MQKNMGKKGTYSYSARHRMHETAVRKNKQGLMGSKTRVHPDSRAKLKAKIDKQEIDDSI